MARQVNKKLSSEFSALREATLARDYNVINGGNRNTSNLRMSVEPFLTKHTERSGKASTDVHSTAQESWKSEAWSYYEGGSLPEVSSIIDITAKSVAACQLRPAMVNSAAVLTKHDDPEISLLLQKLYGPGGGYEDIIHAMAVNYQVTGDGYLFAEPVYEMRPNGKKFVASYKNWEFISIDEITVTGGDSPSVRRAPAGNRKVFSFTNRELIQDMNLGEDYYIQRCWRRSSHYSQLSESALKKNLGICKLLLKLTHIINAVADSQVPAGILLVPDELSLDAFYENLDPGDDAEEALDALTADLIDYMSAATEDHSSPAAISPLVMRGKSEFLKEVTLIRLGRDLDSVLQVIRQELLSRLATGLDAPREMMSGKESANHWGAASIDASFASQHALPLGRLLAKDLTTHYLWPMLRKMIKDGKSNKKIEEVEKYQLLFDPANILARVDKATQAKHLYDKRVLSEAALLEHTGFELKDARTADERLQDTILELIKAAPKSLAPILAHRIKGLEDINIELEALENEAKRKEEEEIVNPEDPAKPGVRGDGKKESINRPSDAKIKTDDVKKTPAKVDGPRREPVSEENSASMKLTESDLDELRIKITALAHSAKQRAIQRAGSRLISYSKKDDSVANSFKNKTKEEIVSTTTASTIVSLGTTHQELFKNSYDELASEIYSLVTATMEGKADPSDFLPVCETATIKYIDLLAKFTITTIRDLDHRFDNGLSVPDDFFDSTIMRSLEWWTEG